MHPAGINWDALVHSTQGHILPVGSQGTWELQGCLQEPGPGSQDRTKSLKLSWCLPRGCCRDSVSGAGCQTLELSSAALKALPCTVVPEWHKGWPRSQPPDLALPFRAENIPPGINEFSERAARQTAARGRTDGGEGMDGCGQLPSCACRPAAPKAAWCQGHGVVVWLGR